MMSSISGLTEVHSRRSSVAAEQSDKTSRFSLSYFHCSLFATALEDILIQLRILVECNNELRICKTQLDIKSHFAQKYGIQQENRDELEGIDRSLLHCNEYKLNKLEADRKYVEEVVLSTYRNMAIYRSFSALADCTRRIVENYAYADFLVEQEAKNRLTRRELNRQLRQQRNHAKSVIYDADNVIDDIKRKVEDADLNNEIESRYIGYWQRARAEQHHQLLHDKEVGPAGAIEYFKQRSDQEQRVHAEIEMIVNINANETLEKIEYWMEKYDCDMEDIDLKIQIMKSNYQNAEDHRKDLERTILEHDKLIQAWVQFKNERESAAQYRNNMTKSALMIQAWWRGLLVRQHLGPYKVAKKKEAAKGKKK